MRAWLLDLYPDPCGAKLWVMTYDDDRRLMLTQQFPVTFYASGAAPVLRAVWRRIVNDPRVAALAREEKQDVFQSDPVTVMSITAHTPLDQTSLFRELAEAYPQLTYYNADLPLQVHHCSRYGTFPLALCKLELDDNQIRDLRVISSRWDIHPEMPPLRILNLTPDQDPAKEAPSCLHLACDRFREVLLLDDPDFIPDLNRRLTDYDPDLLVTDWGDAWMIPWLLERSKASKHPIQLNRDSARPVRWQKETTYFSYGHIIYRPEEAHLFGRCHIDRKSAMMWGDYGLAGALEMSRVTSLPIEKSARVSPGQGISAMQVITALEHDVLVPFQKHHIEQYKTGIDLIQSDRGGMVYQPTLGVHHDVAEVDFVSMYPAIIIKGNISPEVPLPDVLTPASPDLGIVPLTLQPLYTKRVTMKLEAAARKPDDPIALNLKARSSALKWLLVVCFGFLGYKNARFGRIEAHEAVTRGGREVLLRAKETAERMGCEVLHMYVDALWLKRPGWSKPADFEPVLKQISADTGLSIALDGIFNWIAFLPSKLDDRIPVANRFFGVFDGGDIKIRGLECRRRDTPRWIKDVQLAMINCLVDAKTAAELRQALFCAMQIYRTALDGLRGGKVPMDQLVINGKVSYELDLYRNPTASVRAARQLAQQGSTVRPGQTVRYVHTLGDPDVYAWETLPASARPDVNEYAKLLGRAAASVLVPFGIDALELLSWVGGGSVQTRLTMSQVSAPPLPQPAEAATPIAARQVSHPPSRYPPPPPARLPASGRDIGQPAR